MYERSSRIVGFSLIELLVVTAIISVLAGLLFPVFNAIRKRVRETVCASNLQQIGKAYAMYAQDYDSRLPDQTSHRVRDPVETSLSSAWEIYLRPYTKNAEITHCPADTQSKPLVLPTKNITIFSSYAAPFNVQGRRLSEVGAPALTVLLLENIQLGSPGDDFWAVQQLGKRTLNPPDGVIHEQPEFRHDDNGAYLFIDGHVKTLRGPNPKFEGYQTSAFGVAQCGAVNPLPK